jgi:PAS domain S-box-containing protein
MFQGTGGAPVHSASGVLMYGMAMPGIFAGDVYRLLEGAADAAFVTTVDGEICFWSAAAERLTGYTSANVLTKTCDEVLQGKGALGTAVCQGECSVHRRAVQTETIPTFDLEITTHSGQRRWVTVTTLVFEDSRLHRRLLAHLLHDISDRKQLEQAFARVLEVSKQVMTVGNCVPRPSPIESLSEQEARILRLFAAAKNSAQIAKELDITLPTLRNHLHAINQKLRTHNRLEAVMHAIKRGLI